MDEEDSATRVTSSSTHVESSSTIPTWQPGTGDDPKLLHTTYYHVPRPGLFSPDPALPFVYTSCHDAILPMALLRASLVGLTLAFDLDERI